MVVIADSDCVRKLAWCGFLAEFLQAISVPPNDIWILPALPAQVKKHLAMCPDALTDFEKFLKKTKPIPKANVDMLARFENLDGGEQQIFALMCEIERVELVVTGDKKAINRVAALVHIDPSLGALMESSVVLCFEAIMLRLLKKQGFSVMKARIDRWRQRQGIEMDKVMAAIFTAGCTELSVTTELNDRITSLRASCVGVPVQF